MSVVNIFERAGLQVLSETNQWLRLGLHARSPEQAEELVGRWCDSNALAFTDISVMQAQREARGGSQSGESLLPYYSAKVARVATYQTKG